MKYIWYILSFFGYSEYYRLGGLSRSPLWRKFREEQIKLRGGRCELCKGTKTLELHHIESFVRNPSRELDSENVMILCESGKNGVVCHRFFGHLGDYRKINPNVIDDVNDWRLKIASRL